MKAQFRWWGEAGEGGMFKAKESDSSSGVNEHPAVVRKGNRALHPQTIETYVV